MLFVSSNMLKLITRQEVTQTNKLTAKPQFLTLLSFLLCLLFFYLRFVLLYQKFSWLIMFFFWQNLQTLMTLTLTYSKSFSQSSVMRKEEHSACLGTYCALLAFTLYAQYFMDSWRSQVWKAGISFVQEVQNRQYDL